jgi:hypothetical protein
MGANYEGQERAIAELERLSPEAKRFLSHHLGNSLNIIIAGLEVGSIDLAKEAVWHIVEDLELAGISRSEFITPAEKIEGGKEG